MHNTSFEKRINSASFDYLGYPIIELHTYGRSKEIDLFILCQHGFRARSFTDFFPEFLPSYSEEATEDIFSEYLDIEHDYGARKLSKFVAENLATHINVAVITVNCDRGIVDANREDEYCIRPLVRKYATATVLSKLQKINEFIRTTVYSLLKKYLKLDGYILDLHSMWPYTLNKNPDNCSSFDQFVKLYKSSEHIKEKRNINFIVHDINGLAVADKLMASSIEKYLKQASYEIEYDKPYYILPERSNHRYFSNFKGIAIDIPRNLIGYPRKGSFPNFSSMRESSEKVKGLGNAISLGVKALYTS
jgi:hypothetical protein